MIYKVDTSINNIRIIVYILAVIYSIYLIVNFIYIEYVNTFIACSCLMLAYLGRWGLTNKKQNVILIICFIICFLKLFLIF